MGTNPGTTVQDNHLVTVLSSRVGIEKATAALELLYKQASYTLEEQIRWRQPGSGPYKVENNMRIHGVLADGISYSIGHNPMLTLRKVECLKQTGRTISWIEKGIAHPKWLCKDLGHGDCELAGKPAKTWTVIYEEHENLPNRIRLLRSDLGNGNSG